MYCCFSWDSVASAVGDDIGRADDDDDDDAVVVMGRWWVERVKAWVDVRSAERRSARREHDGFMVL
jgi:hypothetical protein